MGAVKEDLAGHGSGRRLIKLLASERVRDMLVRCSQDLQEAQQQFKVRRVLLLLLGCHTDTYGLGGSGGSIGMGQPPPVRKRRSHNDTGFTLFSIISRFATD